jgi:hypothetical protein
LIDDCSNQVSAAQDGFHILRPSTPNPVTKMSEYEESSRPELSWGGTGCYERDVRVREDLPSSGVTCYEVPREYGVTKYRYTVVSDRAVLVDPSTHRIVQVID